eukprot:303803_1
MDATKLAAKTLILSANRFQKEIPSPYKQWLLIGEKYNEFEQNHGEYQQRTGRKIAIQSYFDEIINEGQLEISFGFTRFQKYNTFWYCYNKQGLKSYIEERIDILQLRNFDAVYQQWHQSKSIQTREECLRNKANKINMAKCNKKRHNIKEDSVSITNEPPIKKQKVTVNHTPQFELDIHQLHNNNHNTNNNIVTISLPNSSPNNNNQNQLLVLKSKAHKLQNAMKEIEKQMTELSSNNSNIFEEKVNELNNIYELSIKDSDMRETDTILLNYVQYLFEQLSRNVKTLTFFDPCPWQCTIDNLQTIWPNNMACYVNPPFSNIGIWAKKTKQWTLATAQISIFLSMLNCQNKKFFNEIWDCISMIVPLRNVTFKGYDRRFREDYGLMLIVFDKKSQGENPQMLKCVDLIQWKNNFDDKQYTELEQRQKKHINIE